MKIKDTYLLKNVAGQNLVVPVGGQNINFNAAITLNETAAFLWEKLKKDTTEKELLEALLCEYDTTEDIAQRDIAAFIKQLKDNSILEDEEK